MKTWQFQGEDTWVFGELVRGLVRPIEADIYFDEESDNREGGWVWIVHRKGVQPARGRAYNLEFAVALAEAAMGIK